MHQETWMMGYNHGGELDSIPNSFNGWKLRPLAPRPVATAAATTTANPHCFSRISGNDLLISQNHHISSVTEKNKREFNTQQVVASSRWNPTPEQLQTLEELYRRGTRTPSAEQIQHITAQLRRYGKIEGKNVFYWFQNHKARERQKRRRQLESVSDNELPRINKEYAEKKESTDASRTEFEVEQIRNWASPTNCSTIAEKTLSTQRAAKAAEAECKSDGWVHFDEVAELQQRRSLVERNATWQMMRLSCSSSPTNLMNPTADFISTSCPLTVREIDPKLMKSQDCNLFMEAQDEEFQTLQLFPLQSGHGNDNDNDDDCVAEKNLEISAAPMNTNFTSYQFFEFLPLKN